MLTPDEQQELAGILQRYPDHFQQQAPQEAPQMGVLPRIGAQFADLPSNIAQGLLRSGAGLINMTQPDAPVPYVNVPRPFDIPAPQTFGQRAVDVAAGLGSAVGQALIPGGLVGRAAGALGASAAGASILGDVAAGAFQGLQQSPEEAAGQGAEFGLIGAANRIPNPWVKAAANALIPLAGQYARGNDPWTQEGIMQMGANVLAPMALDRLNRAPEGRGLMRTESNPDVPLIPEQRTAELPFAPVSDDGTSLPGRPEPEPFPPFQDALPPQDGILRNAKQPDGQQTLFPSLPDQSDVRSFTPPGPDAALTDATGEQVSGADHHANVQSAVQETLDGMGGVKVNVIRNESELPPEIREQINPNALHEGLTNTRTGDVWVMSDNVGSPMRAKEVAMHEAVGHYGIDRLLSDGQMQDIADSITRQNNPVTQELASRYFGTSDMGALPPELKTRLGKEYIAKLAENTDLDPNLWQKVMAHVRAAIRALGIDREYSDNEIRDLIRKAGQGLREEPAGGRATPASLLGASPLSERPGSPTTGPPNSPSSGAPEGNSLFPSIRSRLDQAAADQTQAKDSLFGKAARYLETNFAMSRTPEVFRAQEKGVGRAQELADRFGKAAEDYQGLMRSGYRPTAAHDAAAEAFLKSSGDPADVSSLMRAGLPAEAASLFTTAKDVALKGKEAIAAGESGKHAAIVGGTPDYTRRAYQIWTDPKAWQRRMNRGDFDKALGQTVDYFATRPEFAGFDRSTVESSVRQWLAEKQRGTPFSQRSAGGERISQSLYTQKHDLTPQQWKMLEDLRGDRRLDPADQDVIKGMVSQQHLREPDREALKTISKMGRLTDEEASALKEIAEKETVSPEMRELLGEHSNPAEVAAYTVQKILGATKQATTIAEIAKTELSGGRRMAYDPKAYDAAKKAATGDTATKLAGYVELPKADGYGKLAGQWVERGVADALNAFNEGMNAGGDRMYAKIQKVMKLNATVLNPSTHIHNWMQAPLMFAIGREYNPANWLKAGKIVFGKDNAVRSELVRNNIIGADMGTRELGVTGRRIANVNEPEGSLGKIKTGGDKALRWMAEFYRKPDDIVRTAVYLRAKRLALKDGLAEEAAQNRAIDFTNRYSWNYGAAPRAVQAARNLPGLNPFLSYSAELARVTKNLGDDLLHGTAEDRMHAALSIGLMGAVPLALSLGSASANLSPEDQEAWNKIRALEPSYVKGAIKFVTGRRKDGTFDYVDVAPLLPAGDLYKIARDLANGEWGQALLDQPLVGASHSPAASLGVDLVTGQNQVTGRKLIGVGDYASRIAQPLLPPVLGSQLQRDLLSFSRNQDGGLGITNQRTGRQDTPETSLLGHVGLRLASENPQSLMRSRQYDFKEEQDAARQDLMRVLTSDASEAAKEKARGKYRDRVQSAQVELQSLMRSGR